MNDILLDESFDLLFSNGDLLVGDSTRQHQQLLLLASKGEFKEFPTRCLGLRGWLLDDAAGDVNGAIKREYEADGMTVDQINVSNDQINVDAFYG